MQLELVTRMATVIEFYVPEKFRKESETWTLPDHRGRIIPFPAAEKREAFQEINPLDEPFFLVSLT